MHVLLKKRGRWCWMQKGKAGSRKESWGQLVPLTGSGFSSRSFFSPLSSFLSLSFSSFSFFLNTVRTRSTSPRCTCTRFRLTFYPRPIHDELEVQAQSQSQKGGRRFSHRHNGPLFRNLFPRPRMRMRIAVRWRSFNNARSFNLILFSK